MAGLVPAIPALLNSAKDEDARQRRQSAQGRLLRPGITIIAGVPSRRTAGSVLGLVDQRALLDPGHHVAQLCADVLDRMLGELGAGRLERSLVDLVLEHPVARELPGLD